MEAEEKVWWVLRATEKYGPWTRTELKAQARSGAIRATDQL